MTWHAIPEDEWRVSIRMRPAEMVATLRELAQKVRLKAYRKSSRGPKKPRPKREGTTKSSRARSQGSNLWQTHVLALGLARSLRIFL